MNLVITVIGQAVVDSDFRAQLLSDPLDTLDRWGFHLTKGEVNMLLAVLSVNDPDLDKAFKTLEDRLYYDLEQGTPKPYKPCPKPCGWSLFPPPDDPDLRKARLDSKK